MHFSLVGLLATASLALAQSNWPSLLPRDSQHLLRRDVRKLIVPPAAAALRAEQPDVQTINIPIDHFNASNTNTFTNRYWINATYYRPGGPVFLLDVGESTVTDDYVQAFLMESSGDSAVMQLAQKYGGLGLMLEHRFYGQSMPYPVNEMLGLPSNGYEAFQYHTTEQALEDVVYLANHFQPKGLESSWSALAPGEAPWVFIGGSYPGNRAAWARIRNPDVIYASWSSSAPVQTQIDMSSYYETVYQAMTANCSADMAAAARYFDSVFTSGSDSDRAVVSLIINLAQSPSNLTQYTTMTDQQLLRSYRGPSGANSTEFRLASTLVSFIGSAYQSFGFNAVLLPYCNQLERFNPEELSTTSYGSLISSIYRNPLNARPTAGGIAAAHGDEAAFYAFAYAIYSQVSDALEAYSGTIDDEVFDWAPYRDSASWAYQTCTEFGYYQVSNTSSPYNLISSFINLTSWQESQCNDPFASFTTFPTQPDVNKLVDKYGGWTMNPSHVMFTNGMKDPWHTLSVQSRNTGIGAPDRSTTQTVPSCGQAAPNNQVFGLTYQNGYHVPDLLGSTGYAAQGINLFERALDTWIPCFQKHTVNSTATPTASGSATPSNTGGATGGATSGSTSGTGALSVPRNAQLGMIGALLAAVVLI